MRTSEPPRSSGSSQRLSAVGVGNMVGTPFVGAIEWFAKTYGQAALHEVYTKMPAKWQPLMSPHAPNLGVLGAKRYPHAFIGDCVRAMAQAVKTVDEDAFIRDLAAAGIDASVGTVMRILLRYAATPQSLAARGQDAWNLFYDSGRVRVEVTENEYISTTTDWANHDTMMCRIAMEVRRRLIERTGRKVIESRRERCVGWGHDSCVVRIRW